MEKSKILFKLYNAILPFSDFLYILQIEEYSTKRLLKWLPKFFFRRNFQVREKLILTKRALITLVFSFLIWVILAVIGLALFRHSIVLVLLTFLVLCLFVPFLVLIANFAFSLYEEFPKKRIRRLAAQKVSRNSNMKVVTVAGSYGKTTVKNFVEQLAKYTYKTQMIPGNINTPGGIANWILGSLKEDTELLIAEVDAYEIGEIAKSCDILSADIAVLTNIGDQHVERFGSTRRLCLALSEVFSHSKPNAVCICFKNTKDEIFPTLNDQHEYKILDSESKMTYRNESLPKLALSESNKVNLRFALAVTEVLRVRNDFVMDTLPQLELPDRRQQVGTILGYDGIDDSYNISFTTAQAGILAAKELSTQKKKKLLVITAGIPELSKDNTNKNTQLGRFLSENAVHTIILGSMFQREIAQGFANNEQFTLIPSLKEFITTTSEKFPSEEWFLLLQPELNDLYY